MSSSSISVIIPTKDRLWGLQRALESVAVQDGADFEVVIVNDGGGSVESAADPLRSTCEVTVVTHEQSKGPSAARNAGIEVAGGEYVAFLDDDDIFRRGHLRGLAAALGDGADLAYATALVWDQEKTVDDEAAFAPQAFDLPYDPDFFDVMNFMPTSAVACRSPLKVGVGFDTDLPVVEDWELWLRLTRGEGYRVAHVSRAGAIYHRIAGKDSLSTMRSAAAVQSMFRDCYRRIGARWPTRSESAREYRLVMEDVYEIAFAQYDRGVDLPPLWYENVLHVMFTGFRGGASRAQVHPMLGPALGVPITA